MFNNFIEHVYIKQQCNNSMRFTCPNIFIGQLLTYLQNTYSNENICMLLQMFKMCYIMLSLGQVSQKRVQYNIVQSHCFVQGTGSLQGVVKGAETSKWQFLCIRVSILFEIYHSMCCVLQPQTFFMALCIQLVGASKVRNYGTTKAVGVAPLFPTQPMYVSGSPVHVSGILHVTNCLSKGGLNSPTLHGWLGCRKLIRLHKSPS